MAKKLTKRTKKQIINIAVLLVLIAVTFIVVFTSQDINIHDIGAFIAGCNPWYIVGAFGGLAGFILFEAISLHAIAHRLGHKSKFTSSVAYSTSDLYYSAITPSASGGQPASAYYMVRDGMSGGTAGFTVLVNIIAYTIATILVGLFAVAACPGMFGQVGHWLAKLLIVLGFVIQFLLLALLLLCLFRARVLLRIGNWGIAVLAKIHIVKKPEKWQLKLDNVVAKYRACRSVLKAHPMLFVNAMLLNIAQRVSQTLIPCFVMMAARPDGCNFLELFCMQAYVMIGYNSIPLPGGTGVYEYLYPNVFGIGGAFDMKFVLAAMMVSRGISYYICMIVTGLYTLVYHAVGMRKNLVVPDVPAPGDGDTLAALVVGQAPLDEIGKKDKTDKPALPTEQNESEGVSAEDEGEATTVQNDDGEPSTDAEAPADGEQLTADNQEEQENEDGNRTTE